VSARGAVGLDGSMVGGHLGAGWTTPARPVGDQRGDDGPVLPRGRESASSGQLLTIMKNNVSYAHMPRHKHK